jgi:RNA polymerase sigma-70 factor (ECF subfamily)
MSLTNHYSADQLFLLIREGSETAFTIFCERYRDLLFSRAYSLLQDADEAQDVIQDVLVSFWAHRASLVTSTGIVSYLMGAIRLSCLALIRQKVNRRNRQRHYAALAATITGISPLEVKELSHSLNTAITMVSPASRKAFLLLYIERKALKEIADEMEINVQSVKNHIHRALKILRNYLGKN